MQNIFAKFHSLNIWSNQYERAAQNALDVCLVAVYFLALVAFAIALGMTSPQVQAKDFYVTNTTDAQYGYCSSPCTLRDAVDQANKSIGPDRIIIRPGTYFLDKAVADRDGENEILDEDDNLNGDLDITDDVIIEGPFDQSVVIDGADEDRILEIIAGDVTILNIVFTGGRTPDQGGAIENHASLTVWNSEFSNNLATSPWRQGRGGAIANYAVANIYNSAFYSNWSSAGEAYLGGGGAIYNQGNLHVRQSTFEGGYSGGIDDYGSGAGIYNVGNADIRRSSFVANQTEPFGTGAAILNAFGGHLKLVSSTVSGNTSGEQYGGAVSNGWKYFFEPGEIEIVHSTIANNAWNGLYSNGKTYIKNSIIAGNFQPYDYSSRNCRISINYDDLQDNPNLKRIETLVLAEGDNSGCHSDLEIPNTDTFTSLLKPLAYNGSNTMSHAIREHSIAVDTGGEVCPGYDQNGATVPFDGDADGEALCDIGSVEYRN